MKRPVPGKGRPHDKEDNEDSDEQPEEMTSQQFRDDSESGEELDEEENDAGEGEQEEDDDEEDDDGDEASSGYDSAEEAKIKKELQEIPFEVLERLQETGHAIDPAASKGGQKGKKRAAWDSEAADRDFKRENKNRPQEMSSKRPVPRFREVMQSAKREVRDPRFESLSGKLDNEAFRKRYKFFYDEELPKEAARLKTVLAREKNETKKAKLQAKLTKVQQQMKQEKDSRSKEAWEKEQKAKERKLVEAGKKPFFQRKSEKRKAEMVRKYQELKDTGKLEKFMEKKRRKNASKDHRLLPSKRR